MDFEVFEINPQNAQRAVDSDFIAPRDNTVARLTEIVLLLDYWIAHPDKTDIPFMEGEDNHLKECSARLTGVLKSHLLVRQMRETPRF